MFPKATSSLPWVLCVVALVAHADLGDARVSRIEATRHQEWLGGHAFGANGAYELIAGRVTYAVNPDDASNGNITDLTLAPRNAKGEVEFSGDFVVLRPRDPAKARRAMLVEVLNRGRTQLTPFFVRLPAGQRFSLGDPAAVSRLEDAFLFEQGFTMVWVGWQFDIPESTGPRLSVPIADVTGDVRRGFIGNADEPSRVLQLTIPGGYPAADPHQADAVLTIRPRVDAPATVVPREAWNFARDDSGRLTPDSSQVVLAESTRAKQLYELTYRAQGSPLAGLAFAAVRDFVAYLKHGGIQGPLREHPRTLSYAIGYGYSQSARFLRNFVYDGFNADERGRQVFDGLFVASAGAGRGDFNHRFAIPGVAGNSVLSVLEPVDLFPFTDLPEDDPITHERGGLLDRAERQRVVPKILYTYSSTEYWARVGSLAHTSLDGARDVPLHRSTRLYFIAGTPHSIGRFPPTRARAGGPFLGQMSRAPGNYDHFLNPASSGFALRALLLGLDDWVRRGVDPPPSAYPTVRNGELVTLERAGFPSLPGVEFPAYMPRNWRMDFGSRFEQTGVRTLVTPVLGPPYVLRIPRVGADGNESSGIILPHVAVPLGIYAGWNYTNPRYENLDYLAGLFGAFIPFPLTPEERASRHDPRLSIVERYGSRAAYLEQVSAAAKSLVAKRHMLPDDIDLVLLDSARMWDFLMQPSSKTGDPEPKK